MSDNHNSNNDNKLKEVLKCHGANNSDNHEKSVVIGMTGGVASTVVAYLLKKQGFQCIGVSIINSSSNDKYLNSVAEDCQIKDLHQIKAICDYLEIPFYAVNSSSEYRDIVVDKVVASKLGGYEYYSCIDCTQLKISVLQEKAKKLNADFVATGHFAKIVFNKSTNQHLLQTSADLNNDQTYELVKLEQSHFKNLLFPLSEMRLSDVEKIGNSLPVKFKINNKKKCFNKDNPNLASFVEKLSPQTLRRSGSMFRSEDESFIGEHRGIHNHYIGQPLSSGEKGTTTLLEGQVVVSKINPSQRSVYYTALTHLYYNYIALKNFITLFEIDQTRPISCYIRYYPDVKDLAGTLTILNNRFSIVELNGYMRGVLPHGTRIALYNKKGTGAQLLGSGEVFDVGDYKVLNRVNMYESKKKSYLEKNEEESDKMEKSDVFKF